MTAPTRYTLPADGNGSTTVEALRPALRATEGEKAAQTEERQELISGIKRHARQLMEITGWREPVLLKRLGCPARGAAGLEEFEDAELEECSIFLETVIGATGHLDTQVDRRQVVAEMSSLLLVAQRAGVKDAACTLTEALVERHGDLSPYELMDLGEIDAAGEAIRERLGSESLAPTSPYRGEPRVHLSEERILLYLEGKRDILGPRVHAAMRKHIQKCRPCREEVDFCASDVRGERTLSL